MIAGRPTEHPDSHSGFPFSFPACHVLRKRALERVFSDAVSTPKGCCNAPEETRPRARSSGCTQRPERLINASQETTRSHARRHKESIARIPDAVESIQAVDYSKSMMSEITSQVTEDMEMLSGKLAELVEEVE